MATQQPSLGAVLESAPKASRTQLGPRLAADITHLLADSSTSLAHLVPPPGRELIPRTPRTGAAPEKLSTASKVAVTVTAVAAATAAPPAPKTPPLAVPPAALATPPGPPLR